MITADPDKLFHFAQKCRLAVEMQEYNPALLASLREKTNLKTIMNRLSHYLKSKWHEYVETSQGAHAEASFEIFAEWIQAQARIGVGIEKAKILEPKTENSRNTSNQYPYPTTLGNREQKTERRQQPSNASGFSDRIIYNRSRNYNNYIDTSTPRGYNNQTRLHSNKMDGNRNPSLQNRGCFNCGKEGHSAYDCRQARNSQPSVRRATWLGKPSAESTRVSSPEISS